MARGTELRPSASYSRLDDSDSDIDDHDEPLLSMEEALGHPAADYRLQKPRDRFAAHKRSFGEWTSALLRVHRIAFLAYGAILVLVLVYLVMYIRNAFSSSAGNPNIIQLSPAYFPGLGSQRVRIKYGPYAVPPSSMFNIRERKAFKPCEDCLITFMQADLEFLDGSYANADSGMWLHHVVQVDSAVDDTVCGKNVTKRRMAPNRFFASGNERSAVHFSAQGTQKTGYFLSKDSTLVTATELMNETPRNLSAIVTIDYEFIPANPYPAGFQNLTSVWLDVGGCDTSDVPAKENTVFTLSTPTPWTVPHDSRIIFAAGHLHDAGTHIEVLRNKDDVICNSIATYGATSGFVDEHMKHISNMTSCGVAEPSVERNIVRKGDGLDLRAYYDLEKYGGMREADGSLAPVMGIAILYLVPGGE